jgi:hypothetical protein
MDHAADLRCRATAFETDRSRTMMMNGPSGIVAQGNEQHGDLSGRGVCHVDDTRMAAMLAATARP